MRSFRKLLAAAAFAAIAGRAAAANPADLEVWVQINSVLQITVVSATSYDFGALNVSSVAVSSTTFDIKNTGSGVTQTYQLKVVNPAGWTAGASPGTDVYALDAQFNGPAAPAAWSAAHRLTSAYQTSDPTVFAGNETGAATTAGSVRHLWMRFSAPTLSTSSTRKRLQLDVNAVTP